MACRPDSARPEKVAQNGIDELQYKLAHLSIDAFRHFYERAHEDRRLIHDRLLYTFTGVCICFGDRRLVRSMDQRRQQVLLVPLGTKI